MNTRNENDKRNYLAFIEYFGLVFYACVLALIVVCMVLLSSCNRKYVKDGKIYEIVSKCTNGYYQPMFVDKTVTQVWICTECEDDTIFVKYATDWSKDSTISEEKKMYYESLID